MDKRTFLKTSGIIGTATFLSPFWACQSTGKNDEKQEEQTDKNQESQDFSLPELSFAVADLEPHIDKMTMEIHHGKHHAGYVKKLNKALAENRSFAGLELEEIMTKLGDSDKDIAVRNNGGGHYNHSLFWQILSPKSSKPEGKILEAINANFDNFEKLQELFNKEAKTVFGSGWAWLCADENKKLFVTSTPNQDNPLMKNLVEKSGTPILGIDVWEHAYYLNYQNKRGDYISAFWNIINWEQVSQNLEKV